MGMRSESLQADEHRRLGIDLYNRTWTLMDTPGDEMLHCAHASAYHWMQSGGTTANRARSEWLCSRVYALLGRIDDVMNVSGHRISTIEVESALVDHQEVAEAAVCSRADNVTGEAIVAYVTLKGGAEGSVEKLEELRSHVAQKIGPIAKPANIVFTPELPKTRSGKIMRRLLRDVANNRKLGDTTTLADPTVVDEIEKRAADEKAQEVEA